MSKELKKNIELINHNFDGLRDLYQVKRIGIFGSFARHKQTRKSDIDILVEFSRPVGYFRFIELEDRLSAILKRKVDLATKNALKPAIKQEVLKNIVYV